MPMNDADDDNTFALNSIEHSIGKAVNERPS